MESWKVKPQAKLVKKNLIASIETCYLDNGRIAIDALLYYCAKNCAIQSESNGSKL